MLYTYSFQNKKRDLSDILSTVIKNEPRFISNFKTVGVAHQPGIKLAAFGIYHFVGKPLDDAFYIRYFRVYDYFHANNRF